MSFIGEKSHQDFIEIFLLYIYSELNLAVATCMSDRLIDNVLDSLDECHKKLVSSNLI